MNLPYPVWVGQIPKFVALTLRDAGTLEFRAHGTVHEQEPSRLQGFQEVGHAGIIGPHGPQGKHGRERRAKTTGCAGAAGG